LIVNRKKANPDLSHFNSAAKEGDTILIEEFSITARVKCYNKRKVVIWKVRRNLKLFPRSSVNIYVNKKEVK